MEIVDKISNEISKKINAEAKRAFRDAFGEKFDAHVGEITRGVFSVLPDGVIVHEQYSWRGEVFFDVRVVVEKDDKGAMRFILRATKYNNKSKHHGTH